MNNKINITTPELVNLEFELAASSKRIIASLLDTIISYTAILILFLISSNLNKIFNAMHINLLQCKQLISAIQIFFTFILPFGIIYFYYFIFELVLNGQTPGKLIFNIRTIQSNGQKLNFTTSLIRNLLRVIDMGMFFIGVLGIIFTQTRTRIGDLAANTIVIQEKKTKLKLPAIKKEFSIDIPNTILLDNELINILEDFLSRQNEIEKKYTEIIIDKLSFHISQILKVENYLNLSKQDFLEQVYLNHLNKQI